MEEKKLDILYFNTRKKEFAMASPWKRLNAASSLYDGGLGNYGTLWLNTSWGLKLHKTGVQFLLLNIRAKEIIQILEDAGEKVESRLFPRPAI